MNALTSLTRSLRKLKFSTVKHAPELFMYAGIAGTAAATVMACKKTKAKAQILDEHKEQVDELKERASETPMNEYRKEMAHIYATTGVKIVRNYALPGAIGIASVASIMHGHNMLRKWYVDTSVALAAVTNDYNNLYDNLVAEVGEEKAKEIKAGIITEEVEETITDAKGKDKVIKKEVKKLTSKGSMWTLRFDQYFGDIEWVNDFEQNYHKIKMKAAVLENELAVRPTGHLFWIDAVELIFGKAGLKKILDDMNERGLKVPVMCGWIYDSDKASCINIDFMQDPEPGHENDILIVLIPDGNITELAVKPKIEAIEAV